jgi:hypothetical protein
MKPKELLLGILIQGSMCSGMALCYALAWWILPARWPRIFWWPAFLFLGPALAGILCFIVGGCWIVLFGKRQSSNQG